MKKVLLPILAVVLAVGLALPMATPVGANPDPGIVGLWHLDEGIGSTAGDSSGYGNDGTLSGGKFGNALEFDGIDDYVEIPHTTSLDITGQITVEAWINLDTVNPGDALGGTIIRKGAWPIVDPPPNWGFDIQFGKLRAFIYDEGSPYIANGATVLSAGVWYHVAFTYDGYEVQIYLNGVADGAPTSHTGDIDSTSAPVWIGRKDQVAFFGGLIDEVRISNTARYTTGFTPSTTPFSPDVNTVGLWHFDGNANDSSGNNNDGTVYGASWVPAGPTWTAGKFGNALSFDGQDDYVVVPHDTMLNPTSAITVECWAKLNHVTSHHALVRKLDTYALKVAFLSGTGAKLEGWVKIGGVWKGVGWAIPGGANLAKDTWYHFAFSYSSETGQLTTYVNGAADRSAVVTGTIDSTTNPLNIGRRGPPETIGTEYTDGIIDEVHIWDVALTPDEIAWLPPVTNDDFVLKDGTTLPLKFQIFDGDVLVTSPQWVSVEVTGPEGFTPIIFQLGDGVENLRWNADGAYYIANLKTKDWPEGLYTATVGGIVTGTIDFNLAPSKGVGRGNSGK